MEVVGAARENYDAFVASVLVLLQAPLVLSRVDDDQRRQQCDLVEEFACTCIHIGNSQ